MQQWSELQKECTACTRCGLCAGRTNVVFGIGNRETPIMFIGEGPGEQEDLQGIPFVGPAGKLLDDMLSMFPFKNNVVYLEQKGSELRKIFETMAATRFQAIGGVEIVAEDGKLTKALIGGQPIDDEKLYSVATISFLLYGGDSLTLAENAQNMTIYDIPIIDVVLEHIAALNAEGKNITAPSVTHVTIK